MKQVRVEFTTYDNVGKLITSEYPYVSGIPPGESRSDKSYATYFGTEKKATVVVTEVY
jgi:hypothetical protein